MRSAHSMRPRSISFKATSMIDMAFLLITFFIMSIRFGQAGEEEVNLPDADQAKEVTDERTELITVNVTKDGLYIVGGVQQSGGDIFKYLKLRKEESTTNLELVVRGDRKSEFNAIQRIMRISAESGVTNVSLAALQQDDGGE